MNQVLALVLLLLFAAFLLRLDFIFYVAYVLAGVYAWTRWYTPRAFGRLRSERIYHSHAFLGEWVDVTIRLSHDNRLPMPWVQLTETVDPNLQASARLSQVVSLRGRGSAEMRYQVRGMRRGYYRLGPLRLASGDLFGLSQEMFGFVPASYLTVYPRITPLAQPGLPARQPFGTVASTQRLFADPARPMGVREFRSGDSLRQINWKVSAHVHGLMVKTLEPAISLETAVLLNFHRPDYDARDWHTYTEWAVEVAASLAAHLVNQRQPVGLLTNGREAQPPSLTGEEEPELEQASSTQAVPHPESWPLLPPIAPRNGRAHLMKILERLARLEASDTLPLADWLGRANLGLSWGVTVLVVTPLGTEAVCQGLHRLVRAGLNPVLITVQPDAQFTQVRQRAHQLGFAAYRVTRPEHLQQLGKKRAG